MYIAKSNLYWTITVTICNILLINLPAYQLMTLNKIIRSHSHNI